MMAPTAGATSTHAPLATLRVALRHAPSVASTSIDDTWMTLSLVVDKPPRPTAVRGRNPGVAHHAQRKFQRRRQACGHIIRHEQR